MPAAPDRPPLRRDAARNREQLVRAAAAAFDEEGLSASVNAIAASAGVNVATLYRHFPTKDHLVAAVLDTVLEPVAAASEKALAAPDADGVLATFIRECAIGHARHRGVGDALAGATLGTEVRARLRATATAFAEPVVRAAHEAGELRADFDAVDVLVALRMVSSVVPTAENADRDLGRYAAVVARGLRPD